MFYNKSERILLPPILGVVEDDAVSLTVALLEERYLITQAKLYVLTDVKVSLGTSLQVEVVPNTILHTETDVVESLLTTSTSNSLIEQRTLLQNTAIGIVLFMPIIIEMT